MKIKRRKFGRTAASPHATGATHVIKIGFDARKPDAQRPFPGKFNGFVICRDTLDQSSNLLVDFEIMRRLGVTPEAISQARAEGIKAPPTLLPQKLDFVITHDALRGADGSWDFQGTFAEAYECWQSSGLFCTGNGVEATRRMNDGTKRIIECVPVGSEGAIAEDAAAKKPCPYSIKDAKGAVACKAHARLTLCLFLRGADGRPEPLSADLGFQARFRFDTSSEYNPIRILGELEAAAEKLDGKISGITGTLTFNVQRKRHDGGVGIAQQVVFALNEFDIRQRDQQIHQRYLESHGYAAPKQIAAPEAQEPAEADPFDTPITLGEVHDAEPIDDGEEYGDDEYVAVEMEPEPEPAELPRVLVADASFDQLLDALRRYAEGAAADQGIPAEEALAEVAVYQTKRDGQQRVRDFGWFMAPTDPEVLSARLRLLRKICAQLEADNMPFFEVRAADGKAVQS